MSKHEHKHSHKHKHKHHKHSKGRQHSKSSGKRSRSSSSSDYEAVTASDIEEILKPYEEAEAAKRAERNAKASSPVPNDLSDNSKTQKPSSSEQSETIVSTGSDARDLADLPKSNNGCSLASSPAKETQFIGPDFTPAAFSQEAPTNDDDVF